LGLFVFGSLFYTAPAFAQAKQVALRYSIFFPAPHKNSVLASEWAKEIEKRTNGAVKITLYYSGTLTPPDKCYDGVVNGISDIGMSPLSYVPGRFPLTEIFDYPLGCKSGVVATKLINEFYEKFKPKEFSDTKVMYFHSPGASFLHTNKPVRKLEDVKGLKIRSTGTVARVVMALGGAPVGLPIGETYDALSKGVVDGAIATVEALQGWKLGEATKYTTEDYGASNAIAMSVVMNLSKWNALPPDVKKVIEEVNREWIEKTGKSWDEIDDVARQFALKVGHEFIPLSKEENARWVKAVRPLFEEYVKTRKAKGLPADEALKFCEDRLKQLQ
jgi:TRAP-type C4-dicarboxylate transport system substrate-binding protein